jgi:hypothetical protein
MPLPAKRSSVLFSAIAKGCDELVRELLADGASLEAKNRLGAMPLAIAAAGGDVELVQMILERGAPIDARAIDGSTALFQAILEGRDKVVPILLEHHADPNIPGRSDIAPIAAAAYMGRCSGRGALADERCRRKALDSTGKAAMVYAVGRGFPKVVRVLLGPWRGRQCTLWPRADGAHVGGRLLPMRLAPRDVVEALNLLLDHGARINDQGRSRPDGADDGGRARPWRSGRPADPSWRRHRCP